MRRGYRWAAVVAAAVGLGGMAGTAHAVGFSQPVVENVNMYPGGGTQWDALNLGSPTAFVGGPVLQTFTVGPLGPHSDSLVGFSVDVLSSFVQGGDLVTPFDFNWSLYSGVFNGFDMTGLTLVDNGTLGIAPDTRAVLEAEFTNPIPVNTGDPFALVFDTPTQNGVPMDGLVSIMIGLAGNPDSYAGGDVYQSLFGFWAPYTASTGTGSDARVILYVNVPEPGGLALGALALAGGLAALRRRR